METKKGPLTVQQMEIRLTELSEWIYNNSSLHLEWDDKVDECHALEMKLMAMICDEDPQAFLNEGEDEEDNEQ